MRDPADFHAARELWVETTEKLGDPALLTTTIELELRRTRRSPARSARR
ncbi:hypothetical protein ACFQX7_01210 [Luedemannella flava]